MKLIVGLGCCLVLLLAVAGTFTIQSHAQATEGRKPREVYVLAPESKLGTVTFSHLNHTTKNRNLAGTAAMACIECHHTAQPASEVAKLPPLKTAWPADRTTTLTADQFEKDPKAAEVVVCRDCHARAETKPKLLPDIPQIKMGEGTALVTLTNQQAFHRNCAGCHDEIVKTRKDINPPTSKKCLQCHKKAAA